MEFTKGIQEVEIRKDFTVHVSLSSSSLVKQPGDQKSPSPCRELRNPYSTASDNRWVSAVISLI
jgi:hypothetical protein